MLLVLVSVCRFWCLKRKILNVLQILMILILAWISHSMNYMLSLTTLGIVIYTITVLSDTSSFAKNYLITVLVWIIWHLWLIIYYHMLVLLWLWYYLFISITIMWKATSWILMICSPTLCFNIFCRPMCMIISMNHLLMPNLLLLLILNLIYRFA